MPLLDKLKKNFEIKVVAPDHIDSDSYYPYVNRFKYFYPRKMQAVTYNQGVPENLKNNFLIFLQFPFLLISMLFAVYKSAKSSDIIITNWLIPAGLCGVLVSHITKKPHIVIEHSAGIHFMRKLCFKRLLMNIILKNTDKFVFVNDYLAEYANNIIRIDDQKLNIIPMGVDLNIKSCISRENLLKQYNIPQNHFIVMFMGRLTEIKGVDILINAIAGLENCTLIIAGEGSEEFNLKLLADKRGINCIFTGNICGNEKNDLLNRCDVFVLPSRILKNGRMEGSPVVLMEAMACGKIVIASKTGGIPNIIKNSFNGLLFEPENVTQLNVLLKNIYANKDFYYNLSIEAKNSAQKYDVNFVAEQFKTLMDEVSSR